MGSSGGAGRDLAGQENPGEFAGLQDWRLEATDLDVVYRRYAAIWKATTRLNPDRRRSGFHALIPHPETLLQRAEERGGRFGGFPAPPYLEGQRRSWRRWRRLGRRLGLPAVAAASAALAFGLAHVSPRVDRTAPPRELGEITTAASEMSTVRMSDGTSIRLGPNSTLRLHPHGEERAAWLEGKAFFGVDGSAAGVFAVRTPRGTALATGTRFEVVVEGDDLRVLVVEGRVSVADDDGGAVQLEAGEMGLGLAGERLRREKVDDVWAHLAWLGNTLVFHKTPLGRAIEEIELRYGIGVVVEDPNLKKHLVTATFTTDGVEEVIAVLCAVIGADCTVDEARGRAWIHRRRPEPPPHAASPGRCDEFSFLPRGTLDLVSEAPGITLPLVCSG